MSQNQGYGVFEDDRPSKTPFIVLAVLALLVVVGLAGFVYAVGGPGAQERSNAIDSNCNIRPSVISLISTGPHKGTAPEDSTFASVSISPTRLCMRSPYADPSI